MNFIEEKISISGKVSIGATISYINKNIISPAVVLIMGTGKTDRDGNLKKFETDLYKNLAKFFVENGFVCIRYDKRGTYETKGDYNTAGLSDFIDDALCVVRYIKSLAFVDETNVIVCGHSEGTQIATLMTNYENIAGLLLIGGAGICMKDALLYQNRLAVEEFKNKKGLLGFILRSQISQKKADEKVQKLFKKCTEAKKDRVFFGGGMMNAKWVREHGSYSSQDYVDILEKFAKPVLAVTGTADLSADYKFLKLFINIPHVHTYAPSGVNHILRQIDDDNSMLTVQKQYMRLSKQPMHSETKKEIRNWLYQFKKEEKR